MGKYSQTISEIASLVAEDLAVKLGGVCKPTLIVTILTILATPGSESGKFIGEVVDERKENWIKI